MKQTFYVTILVTGLALIPRMAWAEACIISSAVNSSVTVNGQKIDLTSDHPHFAPDCGMVAVELGAICVMQETPNGPRCITVRAGEVYRGTGKATSGLFKGLRQLAEQALGESQKVRGGKRAHDQDVLPGLPYEYILVPRGDLLIPMHFGKQGLVSEFRIENRAQRRQAMLPIQGGYVRLAAPLITPGTKYDWQAVVGGRRYSGSFTFVALDSEPELRDQLKAIRTAPDLGGNRTAQALAEAAALSDHNFTFDAIRVIAPFTQTQ